jgi:hypothetical protein
MIFKLFAGLEACRGMHGLFFPAGTVTIENPSPEAYL